MFKVQWFFRALAIVLCVFTSGAQASDAMAALAIEGLYATAPKDAGRTELDSERQFVTVNDTKLALSVATRAERSSDEGEGRAVVALEVSLTLDGRPAEQFTAESVGVGRDLRGARIAAVRNWVEGYGRAITRMLLSVQGQALPMDGTTLYLGPTAFRPSAPAGWPDIKDAFQVSALATLLPLLPPRELNDGVTAYDLALVVKDRQVVSGSLFLDGRKLPALPSFDFGDRLPEGHYMVKQYFLIVRDTAAADAQEGAS